MDLPEKLLEELTSESDIYFFNNGAMIGVPGHFHICVKRKDKLVFFTACTSQINTIIRFLSNTATDPNTIPCIHPSQNNGFRELTFVDCNRVFDCSIQTLIENLQIGTITKGKGRVSLKEMRMLVNGIKLSKTVADNIKKLFD